MASSRLALYAVTMLSLMLLCIYAIVMSTNARNYLPSPPDELNETVEWMRAIYEKQAGSRAALFQHRQNATLKTYLAMLRVPEVFCPGLVRIGNADDGGKWICGASRLPQNCIVYSLGINEDISFDTELAAATEKRCKFYGVDVVTQPSHVKNGYEAINGKLFVHNISLETDEATDRVNLVDLFHSNGHHRADIVKMDIEGTEKRVLLPFLEEIQMCQLLIELHPASGREAVDMVKAISSFNYLLFSFELNRYDVDHAAEFSFIHESCLEQFGALPLVKWIPRTKE